MYFRCDKIEVIEINWGKRWKVEVGQDYQR